VVDEVFRVDSGGKTEKSRRERCDTAPVKARVRRARCVIRAWKLT
jgi:hypothetical protein|tara:strand:+ start:388 stop:522 length:135 start_codon:yes stop_codon:yes gene_type:complete